ncbi:hypothetical protein E4U54_003281 [Claviceps lovelessii]|nr:hypothetical protein E4U54_003281 [Claviceps lovelessii]
MEETVGRWMRRIWMGDGGGDGDGGDGGGDGGGGGGGGGDGGCCGRSEVQVWWLRRLVAGKSCSAQPRRPDQPATQCSGRFLATATSHTSNDGQ